jgi:hypothetical protein
VGDGFFQKVIRSLALLAATSGGGASVAAELEAIPESEIEAIAVDERIERWRPDDRRALMRLLASDARPGVRLSLVEQVARCPLPLAEPDEDWLQALAADPSPVVRGELASRLRVLLERATALERMRIATGWSVSPDAAVRLAIARALDGRLEILGARTVLAHLAADPVPEVRLAARRLPDGR